METTVPPPQPSEQVSLEETIALFKKIKTLYESVKKSMDLVDIDKSTGP
jgi:hypothetical protein